MRSRILVLARDVALRARLARLLTGGGYRVEIAESVAHAHRLELKGVALAIVATDALGPEGTGLPDELAGVAGKALLVAEPDGRYAADADVLDVCDEASLLARVADALRPAGAAEATPPVLQFAGYRLDLAGHSLINESGTEVPLTRSEFGLLHEFVQRPGCVLSRDHLLQALVGRDAEAFDRSVDMLIMRLRRKIEPDPKHPSLILTVPGSGYKFTAKVQQAVALASPKPEPAVAPATAAPAVPLDIGSPIKAVPGRRIPPGRWIFAAALLVLLVSTTLWPVLRREGPPALPKPDKPSVAVLPFDNLTTDPQWDHLTAGITEDVITDLSMSRDLFVISRNSTAGYKGKPVDPRQVGLDLGIQYVLQGSIQVTGKQAKVTAQLIDSATGQHVWSDRYKRPVTDIFEIQKEVSDSVAGRLSGWQGVIPAHQRALAHRKSPESLQAYDYFLLGMEHQNRANKEDNIKAQALYEKAVELDPHLARAYVGLAWTHCVEIDFAYTRDANASARECLKLASTAVALDPSDADAHAAVAGAYTYLQEWEKSETEIEKAIALNPNDTDALMIYAYNAAWFFGKPGLGKERGERALRLNPINYPAWYNQAMRTAYYFVSEFDNALVAALRFDAPASPDFAQLAPIYAKLGRNEEAKKTAAEVLRLDPDWSLERFLASWGAFKRDSELILFVEGISAAGLPVCASDVVLAKEPGMRRLPMCERKRHAR